MSDRKRNIDKSYRSTTSGRRVVIGHDEYVNRRTGEVEEFAVVKATQADWDFEKIWLYRLVELLDLAGSAKIKVLTWMLEHRDSENRVIATQGKIAEGADVSRKTVNTVLREMKEERLIASPQSGVYRLDPSLIWKGKHHKRMNIMMVFEKELEEHRNIEENSDHLVDAAAE